MDRFESVMIIADTHGSLVDKNWKKKALKFKNDFVPDHVIHLGDYTDATALRVGASREEQEVPLWNDVVDGVNLLEEFECTMVMDGNHDDRIMQRAESISKMPLNEYCRKIVRDLIEPTFKDLRIPRIPYNAASGIRPVGKSRLLACHGFHTNMHAAKCHAEIYNDVIFGHCHTFQRYTARGWPNPKIGIAIGCGGPLRPEYASRSTSQLRWARGWAYGHIDNKTGDYQIWDAVERDGKIWTAEGIL